MAERLSAIDFSTPVKSRDHVAPVPNAPIRVTKARSPTKGQHNPGSKYDKRLSNKELDRLSGASNPNYVPRVLTCTRCGGEGHGYWGCQVPYCVYCRNNGHAVDSCPVLQAKDGSINPEDYFEDNQFDKRGIVLNLSEQFAKCKCEDFSFTPDKFPTMPAAKPIKSKVIELGNEIRNKITKKDVEAVLVVNSVIQNSIDNHYADVLKAEDEEAEKKTAERKEARKQAKKLRQLANKKQNL